MKEGIVISGFDYTGNSVADWASDGYLCYCIDAQHKKGETRNGNIIYVGGDIRDFNSPKQKVVFSNFFVPCTHLAISGAKWFKGKGLKALAESIELFGVAAELAESFDAPYYIENPVSTISTYWRKPDYSFDPCDYAGYLKDSTIEAYTKRTCLWTGHGFRMPKARPVFPHLGSKMHSIPPSADRANLRSATPKGFSLAVHQANRPA